jgi:hypothetical protein
MASLLCWSKEKFGAVSQELENLITKLEHLVGRSGQAVREVEKKARERMDEILHREELTWLQRSCITWLREGDHNTKYFHRKAVAWAKKNKISKLTSDDGLATKDRRTMQNMTTTFFKNLYTADPDVDTGEVTHLFPKNKTDEMNVNLYKDFSEEEIGDTLFQIWPLKVLGPDGFPGRFFQRNWAVLKEDVVTVVREFFDMG